MFAGNILTQDEQRSLEIEEVFTQWSALAIERAEQYTDANSVFEFYTFRSVMYDHACEVADSLDLPEFAEWEIEFLIASFVFSAIAYAMSHTINVTRH